MSYRLVFDTTDVAAQNASANVGAYIRASDGGLIDQTSNALHVDIQNASVVVSATDLDIRDLSAATDSVESQLHDGAGTAITSTGGALDVSIANASLVVSATDLDIRDLSAATDSVAAWAHDGTGNALSSTGGFLDVNIAGSDIEINVEDDVANTAIATVHTSVATSATDLVGTDLAARRFIYMHNSGNKSVFIGGSGVTTGDGFELPPGAMLNFRAGPAIDLHAISISGTQSVQVLELS